jgi:hypothetical protein
VGRDIDRKLCLTAAFLGAVTRKDLAAAFRAVNPATAFDLERAHKWLQGRACPREATVYDDWARLLGLGRPGTWVADCDVDTFADALCARGGALDRAALWDRARAFGGGALRGGSGSDGPPAVVGTYACYSHAWSPYFRGRLARAALKIAAAEHPGRPLAGCYAEKLPTGTVRYEGAVTISERAMHLDLRQPAGGVHLLCCLFPPTPPASVLGGMMCGVTCLGPAPPPSATRIVAVKLPPSARLSPQALDVYLPSGASIAADLGALGLPLDEPLAANRALAAFLTGGDKEGDGIDRAPAGAFQALVNLFDRHWLARALDRDRRAG